MDGCRRAVAWPCIPDGALATTDPGRFFDGRDVGGTFHFPGFAPEAAEWLLHERQVAGIAVDTLSLDHGPSQDFMTHQIWLPAGRWGLENVANLDQVPEFGATLVVGASKVKGATVTCSGHRTGVISEGEPSAKQRKSGRRPDLPSASGVRGAAHARRTVSRANPILRLPPLFGVAAIMQTVAQRFDLNQIGGK